MIKKFNGQGACACPTELEPSMLIQDCDEILQQLYRIAIISGTGTEPFTAISPGLITEELTWTTAIGVAAPDNIVLTPEIANVTIEGGEAVLIGQDSNETPGGAGVPVGHNSVKINGQFNGLTGDNEQNLLNIFNCSKNWRVGLIDINGNILTSAEAIPVFFSVLSASMSGRVSGGFNTLSSNPFTIELSVPTWAFWAKYDISGFYRSI